MLRLLLITALGYSASAQPTKYENIIGTSSYVGGSVIDAQGNVYLAGSTTSADFPVTPNAFQKTFIPATCGFVQGPHGGPGSPIPCQHGFVAKIDPSGTRLLYATYLGGEPQDGVTAIAVDALGNAYVTGGTSSKTFPVTPGAWQTAFGNEDFNGFVTKLKPDGSGVAYSTYLPGGQGAAIAVDADGNLFVAGRAFGAVFPTSRTAYQTNRILSHEDAFVLKLASTGGGLVYSTLIGGTFADVANALAIDTAGNAYVAGYTASIPAYANLAGSNFTPFPTTSGALNQPETGADVFVTKVNPLGTALLYSSVFGGSKDDSIQTLAIDSAGAVYFGGYTQSTDVPVTSGAFRTKHGGGLAGKLSSSGSELVYSTYLSGPVTQIAPDRVGNALVVGSTNVSDVPTTPTAILPGFPSRPASYYSAETYLLQLNKSGSGLLYSTYMEGSIIAADGVGRFCLPGSTTILERVDIFASGEPGIRCVVNAANYRGNGIAPGEIVSLFGWKIGPEQAAGTMIDSSGKVATTLAGTRVLVGGVPAPLLYVSETQINAVIPFETVGKTQTSLQIEKNGLTLPPFQTAVVDAAPGIFTFDGSGYGPAAALNQDGSVNSEQNAAEQDSIVTLFATGLGAMTPKLANGSISMGSTTKPVLPVQMRIGGAPFSLDLHYLGNAPGFVEGAVQINAVVPRLFKTGPQMLNLTVGDKFPPIGLNVTIFVVR